MQWLVDNWATVIAVLFAISEALALIPSVKSNSVFTLIYNLLKSAKDKLSAPQA